MKSILIYGGSFDPPHLGHLNTALAVQNYCHFDTVYFIPCKKPVLKKTILADENHRLKMLQLLLNQNPEFQINTVELNRETPSYMTETLQQIRKNVGKNCSITLLVGMDAFANLALWHEYKKLPRLCNLLVINRGEIPFPEFLIDIFPDRCQHAYDLLDYSQGKIAFFDAGNFPISSTQIREKIQSGKRVSEDLPKPVEDYIKHHGLYQ